MSLLRLLLWLRLRLWWRSLTSTGRWVAIVAPLGLLLLFWPVWFAGSMGAWWAVRELRGSAFALVLGLVQSAWVSAAVLAASAGQALTPRELLRYPVRPSHLFAFNAAAAVLEPATIVLVVPVAALVVAAFAQHGALAGGFALLGAALSMALTVTALQLLVAVLERLLRTEWMRMLSRLLLALVFLGVSWSYSALVETGSRPRSRTAWPRCPRCCARRSGSRAGPRSAHPRRSPRRRSAAAGARRRSGCSRVWR